MCVYCPGTRAKADDEKVAENLLACLGRVLRLPERQFDAVTALSGSGPAFFAYVMDTMVQAGVQEGLDREDAELLCAQTMFGTAQLLVEKKLDAAQLVRSVASARGTTAAGLAVFEESPLAAIIRRAIGAAADRSREMSGAPPESA